MRSRTRTFLVVAGAAAALLRDVAGVAGVVSTVYGVSLISVPAAWIVGGTALVAGAWLLAGRD